MVVFDVVGQLMANTHVVCDGYVSSSLEWGHQLLHHHHSKPLVQRRVNEACSGRSEDRVEERFDEVVRLQDACVSGCREVG